MTTAAARAREIAEWAEDKGFTSPRQLEARIAAAITDAVMAERARSQSILVEARDMVQFWGAYASDYFKEKHGFDDDLKKLNDAIAAGAEGE